MKPLAYYNSELIDRDELTIDVRDLGFMMGTTVSERLRTFRGNLFQLEAHLERLQESLNITQMQPDIPMASLHKAAVLLASQNHSLLPSSSDLGLSILVTPGLSGTDQCNVMMYTDELPFTQMLHWYQHGVSLQVSDHRQVPANCWPSELKCRSRMHYYLADQQARQIQPGARALLLDQNGFVAEASTANILIYENQKGLVSPRRTQILPGISLSVLQSLAAELDIPMVHDDITIDRLMMADEVLLCSTSPCIWPVNQCNGHSVGNATNPITERLLQAWSNNVKMDILGQAKQLG